MADEAPRSHEIRLSLAEARHMLAALALARKELQEHNNEYQHTTPPEVLDEILGIEGLIGERMNESNFDAWRASEKAKQVRPDCWEDY